LLYNNVKLAAADSVKLHRITVKRLDIQSIILIFIFFLLWNIVIVLIEHVFKQCYNVS